MQSLGKLIATLRQIGFEISTAEVIEAHELLEIASSRDELRLGLRMIIAKSKQEQELFDFVWELYEPKDRPSVQQSADMDDIEQEEFPIQPPEGTDAEYCPNPPSIGAGAVGSNDPSVALIRFTSDLKGSAKQMIQGNYENAAAIVLRYILGDKLSLADISQQRAESIAEIKSMLDEVVPDHSDDLIRRLDEQIDELLKERMAMEIPGRDMLKIQNLEDLSITALKSSPELTHALRKLGKKLATKHRRKIKRGRRKINLRQTIRANIQHGGVLLELKHTKPRLDRPKLQIITDVSSSTLKATRMFLTIIWHAKEVFSDIRFYEFISSMIDVTPELKRAKSVQEGIEAALDRWNKEEFGKQNSDYYVAFRKFKKLRGDKLSQKDTVIVLGDLRDWLGPWQDNYPLSATVMGDLAKMVKRFIVLNPERKSNWNSGDSIVQYVEQQGIEVYEANTLQKLIDVLLTLE